MTKYIEWEDPALSKGPDSIIHRCLPETAIKIWREAHPDIKNVTDEQALEDFKTIQYAQEIEYPDLMRGR